MLRTLGERLDRSKLITGLVRRAEDKDSGPPRPPTLPFNFPLPRHCLRFSVGDPKLSDPPSLYVPPRPFLSCPHPAHRNAQTPAPGPAPNRGLSLRPTHPFPARLLGTCVFQGTTAPNVHIVPSLLPVSLSTLYISPLSSAQASRLSLPTLAMGDSNPESDPQHQPQPAPDSVQPQMTMHPITYSGVPMHMYPFPPGMVPAQPTRTKRRQVKNACTNCQKACKKCDDARPCLRCVKYGVAEECVDSQRKERQKGIKRGPYKKRDGKSELLRFSSLILFFLSTVG